MLAAWFAAVNGWRMLAVIVGAAAVHELGHWLVLRLLGAKILDLRIGMFGAVLETDSACLSYGGELASVLAGPGANLVSALGLSVFGGGAEAVGAHVVLALFNLLPIRPLDGGRALYLLVAWAFGPAAGERAARGIGAVTAAALTAGLGCLMYRTGGSLWLLPAAAGLLAASWRECLGKTDIL